MEKSLLEEADFRIEKSIMYVAERLPEFANWTANFASAKKLMSQSTQSSESLSAAFVMWQMFPFYLNAVINAERDESAVNDVRLQEGLVAIEGVLISQHKLAVRALMSIAESIGVDSTQIGIAGQYCRQLMEQRRQAQQAIVDTGNDISWPECIWSDIQSLPNDVRNSIALGNASVDRAVTRSGLKGRADTESLVGISNAEPETTGTMLVTIADVSRIVGLEPKSMTRYVKEWGKPVATNSGRTSKKFNLDTILPILKRQFPKINNSEWNNLKQLSKLS